MELKSSLRFPLQLPLSPFNPLLSLISSPRAKPSKSRLKTKSDPASPSQPRRRWTSQWLNQCLPLNRFTNTICSKRPFHKSECWIFYVAWFFFFSFFRLCLFLLRRLVGKRLCFEKCFLNRSSKYKSLCGCVPLSQSQCVSLSVWVFVSLLVCLWLEMCFLCRTCKAIKPSRVAWSARSVCCCYLRSNPALWPHHQQHNNNDPRHLLHSFHSSAIKT